MKRFFFIVLTSIMIHSCIISVSTEEMWLLIKLMMIGIRCQSKIPLFHTKSKMSYHSVVTFTIHSIAFSLIFVAFDWKPFIWNDEIKRLSLEIFRWNVRCTRKTIGHQQFNVHRPHKSVPRKLLCLSIEWNLFRTCALSNQSNNALIYFDKLSMINN